MNDGYWIRNYWGIFQVGGRISNDFRYPDPAVAVWISTQAMRRSGEFKRKPTSIIEISSIRVIHHVNTGQGSEHRACCPNTDEVLS